MAESGASIQPYAVLHNCTTIKAVKQFTKLFLTYTNKSESRIVSKRIVNSCIEE